MAIKKKKPRLIMTINTTNISPKCNDTVFQFSVFLGFSFMGNIGGKNSHYMIIYCWNETTSIPTFSKIIIIFHILGEILHMQFWLDSGVLRVWSKAKSPRTYIRHEREKIIADCVVLNKTLLLKQSCIKWTTLLKETGNSG